MVDHSNSSSQRKPGQQPQPHHSHFQVPRRHYSYQDIHGPLSAGVVEGGHRPFASFHSTPLHHPLHTSSSLTAPTAAPPPPSASTPSRPSLSVAEILERYHDASKDFLVSVLNAKAKEDERRAEEERYMTERIKLQSKQLDIQLAAERLRGSPPARTYPSHSTEAPSGPYASSSLYYGSSSSNSYSHYSSADASRSHPSSSKHSHLDHIAHTPQEPQDPSQSTHQGPLYSHHDKHAMQPSPQSRPPFLKINTAVRQYHPQPPSTQRMPPSPHSTLPPLPSTNPPKTSNRHYGLPPLSSSAQSSPAAVVDYQSHIPPPLTPKDDHVSPTSALSPTHMKRKSLNHDAVMDAVRAKVFRNAAGQQHQQQTKKTAIESEHDLSSRRKIYQEKPSPEVQKKQPELVSSESRQDEYPEVKLEVKEGPLLSSLPVSISSPASPSSKNTENGETSSRSRSSSPPPSSSTSSKSRRPMGISQQLELASVSEAMEDVNVSNSETDGRRPDRTAENGVSAH